MFELVDGESVCTWGSGVLAEADGVVYLGCCEGGCSVVEWEALVDCAYELSGGAVMGVRCRSCELFHKSVGDFAAV